MRRTQIYLTDDEHRAIERLASDAGTTKAQVIRTAIDRHLGLGPDRGDRVRAIVETAGVLAGAPDWPEWLADARGRGADARLSQLGL